MAYIQLKSEFILIYSIFSLFYCQSLNDGSNRVILDEKVDGLCEYIKNIDQVLIQTENNDDSYNVAWTYGYLSALLSHENAKLKSVIDIYSNKQLQEIHAHKIFECLQKFATKLNLNNYILNHQDISKGFKIKYLPASEDIRSILESGMVMSFLIYKQETSNELRNRFLKIYNSRKIFSDPINKIFEILHPESIMNNSLNSTNFISQISSWSKCDNNSSKLLEMLTFLNSLQRYLITGIFAEEFHLLLNFRDRNTTEILEKYLKQLEYHRKQYRSISQSFTVMYSKCYLSLKDKQNYQMFRSKSVERFPILNLKLYATIIIILFIKFYY